MLESLSPVLAVTHEHFLSSPVTRVELSTAGFTGVDKIAAHSNSGAAPWLLDTPWEQLDTRDLLCKGQQANRKV